MFYSIAQRMTVKPSSMRHTASATAVGTQCMLAFFLNGPNQLWKRIAESKTTQHYTTTVTGYPNLST